MKLFKNWNKRRIQKLVSNGRSLNCDGKTFRAVAKFKRAIGLMKNSPAINRASVLEDLGDAYIGLEDWEEACEAYKAAVSNDRNNGEFWFTLGECHANLRQNDEALKCFNQSVWLLVEDARSLDYRASALKRLGFTEAADQWTALAFKASMKDAWRDAE